MRGLSGGMGFGVSLGGIQAWRSPHRIGRRNFEGLRTVSEAVPGALERNSDRADQDFVHSDGPAPVRHSAKWLLEDQRTSLVEAGDRSQGVLSGEAPRRSSNHRRPGRWKACSSSGSRSALWAAYFFLVSRSGPGPGIPLAICIGLPAVVVGIGQLFRYAKEH